MPEQQKDEMSLEELFLKLKRWICFLIRSWLWLVIFSLIGLGAALIYTSSIATTYTARMTFAIAGAAQGNTTSSALSAYSGIASQLGVNLGASSAANVDYISGNNLNVFLNSFNILSKVLLTKYDSVSGITIAEKYLEVYKMTDKTKSKQYYRTIFSESKVDTILQERNGLINSIIGRINKYNSFKMDPIKGSSFFSVSVEMRDPRLSLLYCQRLFDLAINEYVQLKINKQQKIVQKLQKTSDSIRSILNVSTYSTLSEQDRLFNLNPAIQRPRAQTEVSVRDKQLLTNLYGQIAMQLDASKLSLNQETPNIQILDDVLLPLPVNEPSYKRNGLVGLIAGLFIGVFLVTLYRIFRKFILI